MGESMNYVHMDGWMCNKWKNRQKEPVSRSFCLSFFFPAAVDYLAKNVSLSTQRRMKLGEHSAVLGLLPVETGQAY